MFPGGASVQSATNVNVGRGGNNGSARSMMGRGPGEIGRSGKSRGNEGQENGNRIE